MRTVWICAAAVLFATTGCSVYFHGSAPAPGGKVYVVGGKQGFFNTTSSIWICPAEGDQATCEKVEVVKE